MRPEYHAIDEGTPLLMMPPPLRRRLRVLPAIVVNPDTDLAVRIQLEQRGRLKTIVVVPFKNFVVALIKHDRDAAIPHNHKTFIKLPQHGLAISLGILTLLTQFIFA